MVTPDRTRLYQILFAPQDEIDADFREIYARYRTPSRIVRMWRAVRREMDAVQLWLFYGFRYREARSYARQLMEEPE